MIEVFDLSRATDLDKQKLPIKTVNGVMPDENGNINTALAAYPVGSIYMSINSTNPSQLFGGTWVALNEGRVLIGAGTAYPAGSTGGEATHTLTTREMPSHSHSGSTSSAGSHYHYAFNNDIGSPYEYVTSSQVANKGAQGGATAERYTITGSSSSASVGKTDSDGSHSHSMNLNNTGGGAAHNNMQPYLSVYMWTRTA